MLKISLGGLSNLEVMINCPQCGNEIYFNWEAFSSAIGRRRVFVCADCNNEFYFELHCLTRAAELPLEPSAQQNGADEVCAKCGCAEPFHYSGCEDAAKAPF